MKEIKGNFWDHIENKMLIIPTNSVLDTKGNLVMGAGLAKQVKEKEPRLPTEAGKIIKNMQLNYGIYRFLTIEFKDTGTKWGLLQTKVDWRDPSCINLISDSLFSMLYALRYTYTVDEALMTLPGTGKGGISKEESYRVTESILEPVSNRITLII